MLNTTKCERCGGELPTRIEKRGSVRRFHTKCRNYVNNHSEAGKRSRENYLLKLKHSDKHRMIINKKMSKKENVNKYADFITNYVSRQEQLKELEDWG
jgi:hypothetical protein